MLADTETRERREVNWKSRRTANLCQSKLEGFSSGAESLANLTSLEDIYFRYVHHLDMSGVVGDSCITGIR